VEEFVIDIGLDAEELPNLPILERDLQNVIVSLVGERLYFGIEDFNGRYVQRWHKVRTILHLLFAFPAEHHKCENLGVLYTEQMYGMASILIYRRRTARFVARKALRSGEEPCFRGDPACAFLQFFRFADDRDTAIGAKPFQVVNSDQWLHCVFKRFKQTKRRLIQHLKETLDAT